MQSIYKEKRIKKDLQRVYVEERHLDACKKEETPTHGKKVT